MPGMHPAEGPSSTDTLTDDRREWVIEPAGPSISAPQRPSIVRPTPGRYVNVGTKESDVVIPHTLEPGGDRNFLADIFISHD